MARPGTCGLGPGRGLKFENCVAGRAGPGHTFCGPARPGPGPGPGLIIQFAGRVCTTAAGRAGPGLGLKSHLRAGPGPNFQARVGPYKQQLIWLITPASERRSVALDHLRLVMPWIIHNTMIYCHIHTAAVNKLHNQHDTTPSYNACVDIEIFLEIIQRPNKQKHMHPMSFGI